MKTFMFILTAGAIIWWLPSLAVVLASIGLFLILPCYVLEKYPGGGGGYAGGGYSGGDWGRE